MAQATVVFAVQLQGSTFKFPALTLRKGRHGRVCACNPSAGSQTLEDPRSSLSSNSHRKMTSQASGSVSDTFSSKQGRRQYVEQDS